MSEPARAKRQRRKVYDDRWVAGLPVKPQVYLEPDPQLPGFGVRVYPSGARSFFVVQRDSYKKQRWISLGDTRKKTIDEARAEAREVMARLKRGEEPFEPPPPPKIKADSVADVVAQWLRRRVEADGLRTQAEIKRVLDRYVLSRPEWRDRDFAKIERRDVARLLDAVEDKHSKWVSDSVLTNLRNMSRWWIKSGRAPNDYVSPFREMGRRVDPEARERSRILSDAELRAIWRTANDLTAAEQPVYGAAFGRFVQLLILTGQRLAKVATMQWDDIAKDGTWTIRKERREKGNAELLRLPPLAMAIINAQPRFASNPYVFPASRGTGCINGFGFKKAAFDKRAEIAGAYTLHDLRRSCRSLLSRAGVKPHIGELVLGHRIGSKVQQIYDRHTYDSEKSDALIRLAALIETIVHGEPGGNVVAFPAVRS